MRRSPAGSLERLVLESAANPENFDLILEVVLLYAMQEAYGATGQ